MSKTAELNTNKVREKVLLVIIDFANARGGWTADQMYKEMVELVVACGGDVVDNVNVRLNKPTASYLISEGRVKDITNLSELKNVDTVIFSHDLKGSQQRNIEAIVKIKTIDRTQLILDIFSKHATSQEGRMQVELAQLEYLLPRLVGKGIELSRLGGGIGTLGPGETKLEVDRRRISQRIGKLKKNLTDVAARRVLKRKKRKEKGVPAISFVGYTNAGKSTLLNTLTNAQQITRDGLFTTLDSLSRQLILPNRQKVILSDTVGFMNELPHRLIEAFKATLEEVRDADLLIHVLDVSHPHFRSLCESVLNVLKEIEAFDKPIITVLNKIDKFGEISVLGEIQEKFQDAVCLCAKTGENIEELLQLISQKLSSLYIEIDVNIPINRMDLVNLLHKEGEVYFVKYYNDKIHIRASVPSSVAGKFQRFPLDFSI